MEYEVRKITSEGIVDIVVRLDSGTGLSRAVRFEDEQLKDADAFNAAVRDVAAQIAVDNMPPTTPAIPGEVMSKVGERVPLILSNEELTSRRPKRSAPQ